MWELPHEIPSGAIWAYGVCFNVPVATCRWIQMSDYFSLAKKSIEIVVQHVSRMRVDFREDRFWITPEYDIYRNWEFWKRFLAIPLRHIPNPEALALASLGIILGTLAERHNFTFNTIIETAIGSQQGCQLGYMHMTSAMRCAYKRCQTYHQSFNSAGFYSTMMSSGLDPISSHRMTNLRMPVDKTAFFVIVGSTICVIILLCIGSSKRLGLMPSIFLAF